MGKKEKSIFLDSRFCVLPLEETSPKAGQWQRWDLDPEILTPDRYLHTAPFCLLLINKLLRWGKRHIWSERWMKEKHWTWVGKPHNRRFSEHCYLTVPAGRKNIYTQELISCQIYKQSKLNNHFGDPSAPGISMSRSSDSRWQVQLSRGHIIIMDQIRLCFSSKCSVKEVLGFLTSSLSWAGLDKII